MFTGIVEKTGKLKKIENKKSKIYFTIGVANFLSQAKIGDSISCDGVCLTVVNKTKTDFTVELMPETLRLTIFNESQVGDLINLELATKLGERLNGHLVSGHVDCTGTVKKIETDGEYTCLIIKIPKAFAKYLAYKGSVAVNGVSLTTATAVQETFKICLISHTLKITNLSTLKVNSRVNIEVDLVARYLEKLLIKQ